MLACGIYAIICLGTGKYYIGSSRNIFARFDEHQYLLKKNKHPNKQLQDAWNQYSERLIVLSVLELTNKEKLKEKEQEWLDRTKCYNPGIGYNECQFATSTLGYKHKEEYKIKKSKQWIVTSPTGEEHTIRNLKQFCKDYSLSWSYMTRLASGRGVTHMGWKCRKSDVSNEELSQIHKQLTISPEERSNAKQWLFISPNGEKHYSKNLAMFCKKHDLSEDMMRRVAKGNTQQHRGWTCSYVHPLNR